MRQHDQSEFNPSPWATGSAPAGERRAGPAGSCGNDRDQRRPIRSATAILLGLAGLALGVPAHAETIYDNSVQNFYNMFYGTTNEFGDEVELGGTARTITEFQFQYFGDFTPQGGEQVTVRFYLTDGHWTNSLSERISAPGTLIYTSDSQPIYPGFNTVNLSGLALSVGTNFVWTVQFQGVSQSRVGDKVGLTFYNPPFVGFSYDDFWVKLPPGLQVTGWTPFRFGGTPVANYAARVIARPDPPLQLTSVQLQTNGAVSVQVEGPTYRSGVLEASADLRQWSPLHYFMLQGQPFEYLDPPNAASPLRFYRVRTLPRPLLALSTGGFDTNNAFQISVHGLPGSSFTVEASRELVFWFPILTNSFPGFTSELTDTNSLALSPYRFYRAAAVPDPPVLFEADSVTSTGQSLLRIYGPAGQDCVIQKSVNLSQWQSVGTNTFSFAADQISYGGNSFSAGSLHFLDTDPSGAAPRFYRAQLLP